MTNLLRTGLLGGLLALAASPLAAQVARTPRSLGMAGAYTAVARGQEALFYNPANLGLHGNPYWSVAFPQIILSTTMVGPGLGDLPNIQKFDNLSPERRDALLAKVPAGGSELGYELYSPLLSVQSGGVGVALGFASVGSHTVAYDLVDLLFNGYDEGRTDYRVGDTHGERATYMDVAAGYGRAVGPLSVGVTGHYYRGSGVVRSRLFEPRYNLAARDLELEYVGVNSPGGNGYGVDVGAAFQPSPAITLSAAVTNVLSKMTWSEDMRVRRAVYTKADFADPEPMNFMDRYDQSERDFDPASEPLSVRRTAEGLLEGANFPATLRAGAAWQPAKGTDVDASFTSRLSEGTLAGPWQRSLAVGVQKKLPLVTARAGFASNLQSGDDSGSLLTGGLTLGVVELGLGRYRDGAYAGTAREGWVFSFGFGTRTTAER